MVIRCMYSKILARRQIPLPTPCWLCLGSLKPARILLPEFRGKQLICIIFSMTIGGFSGVKAIFSLYSGRTEFPEEVDYGGVDLGGPLLLGPVAATGKHDRLAQLRHKIGKVGNQPVHAGEGHHRVAVAGDVEGRYHDLCSGEGRQEFPVAVDVAIPVEPAAKPGAGEFARIEID